MDQATILQILKNHGAPPTPENMQRVLEQSGGGSRGTELLGRSMGLQGGMDESGPGMDLMLDKVMKSTSTPSQMPTEINPNSESNGVPQNGGAVARPRVPMQARPVAHNEAAGSPLQQSGGVPARPSNGNVTSQPNPRGGGDPNVLDGSTTRGYQNETANREAANRPLGGSDDSSGLNWLLAALGLTAAGASMRGGIPINNPPQITGPAAPALIEGANPNQKRLTGPAPQLTDESGPKMESGAPVPPKQPVGGPAAPQTPDDVAKLKAEVDAENAALKAQEAKSNANARGKGAGAKGAEGGTKSLIEALKAFRSMR